MSPRPANGGRNERLNGTRPLVVFLIVGLLLALPLAEMALAEAGSLDRSFGGDGKVTARFDDTFALASGVAVQPNGKVVVVGDLEEMTFALARFNRDGSLDMSFSRNGKATTSFGSGRNEATGVAIQADHKIVVAGSFGPNYGTMFAVARYNPDGTLDPSFDGDGKVTTDFNADPDAAEFVYDVAIQEDGKIVVIGSVNQERFAVARYDSDGGLDVTFDGDGMVTTKITRGEEETGALAIQSDGRIVVAGHIHFAEFAVVRYNPDGTLDTSFDGDGVVTTNFRRRGEEGADGVAVQANGKIVVGGFAQGRFALARYRTNGALDPRFSGDGKVATNFTPRVDAAVGGVGLEPDGSIVAVGYADGGRRFAVARYRRTGALDPSFGSDGRVTTSLGRPTSAWCLAIGPSGKILAAGDRFAVARYRSM